LKQSLFFFPAFIHRFGILPAGKPAKACQIRKMRFSDFPPATGGWFKNELGFIHATFLAVALLPFV